MKNLFNIIAELVEITGNSSVDIVLLWIIGILSFSIAFDLVGCLFDLLGFFDAHLMSDIHCFFRMLIFLVLSAVCIEIAKFITWLFSFQWWVYLIMFIVIIGLVVLIYYLKYKHNKKKNLAKIVEEKKTIEHNSAEQIVIYSRDTCPRCGGKLVKRHGPYRDFYGCENFPSKNCRYTRKFK